MPLELRRKYSSTSAGDVVQKQDANGSITCYHYDALHRVTDVAVVAGSNSGACKRFRYDSSTGVLGHLPTGVTAPSNPLGRLVEAETDTCAAPITQSSIITDEWFSYDADGHPTDMWQSTPHSAGYYHTTASFWPHGMVKTLGLLNSSGTPQIPTQTFGVDAEGRPASVTAATGQNPVSGVTYVTANGTGQPVGALTQVTFGSLDSDGFQYDVNTGRMTQYSFNISGQSAVGNLTWNTNGTLQKLAITDPFNSQDNQTCTYSYDDLARTAGANCGSAWAQTFTYDAFGNITKSGSISWQPIYNNTTNDGLPADNKYKTGWNGASYDQAGNLLNDTFNIYTWDAYGSLASANGASIAYDAFGRMVENSNGTTQFVYAPTGGQPLAVMNAQNLNVAYVRLPGGAFAIYKASGLYQYNHPDWLGSARLFSTPSRSVVPGMAYAPFGEGYAGNGWIQFTSTGNSWTVADNQNQGGSLEDFTFRRYNPTQGRWISPDPAGLGAVDPRNPQSWNRYAYVGNNPLSFVDPSGLKRRPCGNPGGEGCGGDPEGDNTVGNMYAVAGAYGWSPNGLQPIAIATVGGLGGQSVDAYFNWLEGNSGDVTQERDDSEPGAAAPPYYILFVGYAGTLGPYNFWHYAVVDSSKSLAANVKVREVLFELFSFGLSNDVQGGDPLGYTPIGGQIYDEMGQAGAQDGMSWGLQSWQVEVNGAWVDTGPTMLQGISYQNGQLVRADPIQLSNPTPFTNPVPYSPRGSFPP